MELLHSTRSHSWRETKTDQVTVQQSTEDLLFCVWIVPYTRSSEVACMEPNSLLYQDRWSFCCGLSQLSPDGEFCYWSISPHHSPPQSWTWTLSCSMSSSWTDYKHNIGKMFLLCSSTGTYQTNKLCGLQSSWEKRRLKSEKWPIKSQVAVVDVNYSGSQKQNIYAVCVSKASQAPSNESGFVLSKCLYSSKS